MSFEGLSPELMLCVRIRRERLWCSRPASKRSRQVFRRLLDQTAWDPNLGSRRVLRPILPRTEVSERQPPFRQDARTQIDRPSRDVRTHRAKENTCDNHFARTSSISLFRRSKRRKKAILKIHSFFISGHCPTLPFPPHCPKRTPLLQRFLLLRQPGATRR